MFVDDSFFSSENGHACYESDDNRPYSYSRNRTGTSLRVRLIYICGAFSNAPNKQSRANSSTLGQPLPPAPNLQCWTRVHVISPEFQHCIGGGGGKG